MSVGVCICICAGCTWSGSFPAFARALVGSSPSGCRKSATLSGCAHGRPFAQDRHAGFGARPNIVASCLLRPSSCSSCCSSCSFCSSSCSSSCYCCCFACRSLESCFVKHTLSFAKFTVHYKIDNYVSDSVNFV